ncbi:hypothetical protein [Lysinibacillus parviboronicapiens]|uniref:hypothetical protein n=1 Tax=Lysinibacillus parviboronicapiens TaxID=436516 RepID=UPI000D3662CA|nr:hypothetical protein [Lysinibacillus parviboronicapiens]
MENNLNICKTCGNDSFATGQLGHSSFTTDSNVRPIGSLIASGSPLILSFCKNCGEVTSLKVAKPEKFK